MHNTKRIGCIYGEMILKQCPHSSQLLPKLLGNPDGTCIQEISQEINRWRTETKKWRIIKGNSAHCIQRKTCLNIRTSDPQTWPRSIITSNSCFFSHLLDSYLLWPMSNFSKMFSCITHSLTNNFVLGSLLDFLSLFLVGWSSNQFLVLIANNLHSL